MTPEQIAQIKRQYVHELLQSEHVKKDAQLELDDIYRCRTDLVEEIMHTYSLDKNVSESTYYHDGLCKIFDICLWNIRLMVKKGRWEELGI